MPTANGLAAGDGRAPAGPGRATRLTGSGSVRHVGDLTGAARSGGHHASNQGSRRPKPGPRARSCSSGQDRGSQPRTPYGREPARLEWVPCVDRASISTASSASRSGSRKIRGRSVRLRLGTTPRYALPGVPRGRHGGGPQALHDPPPTGHATGAVKAREMDALRHVPAA